jgi:hypothetical protein
MTDCHSPSFFLAGRSVHAVRNFLPVHDLSVADPDAVLGTAQREIAGTLAVFLRAPNPDARRAIEADLLSMSVGAVAWRRSCLRNDDWFDAVSPLERTPAARTVWRGAQRFVDGAWQQVQRLARILVDQKQLPVYQVCWIRDVARKAA